MMSALRVLVVEDDADDAELVVRTIVDSLGGVDAVTVSTAVTMGRAMAEAAFDVVISDYSLPGFGAAEALTIARHVDPDVPFLLVSGAIGEEAAAAMVGAGADEFVSKDRLNLLPEAVQRSLVAATARRCRRAEDTAVRFRAVHDELTGLPNRGLVFDHLARVLARQAREGGVVGVLLIDLDGFKHVNDLHGHQAGDIVLETIARRLQSAVRETDMVGRYGGDEFIAVCHCRVPAEASAFAARMVAAAAPPIDVGGDVVVVTASGGISIGRGLRDAQELIRQADVGAYRAKRAGGNRHAVVDGEMWTVEQERMVLAAEFDRAFSEREFRVFFQPEIDLATGRMAGAEALVRWEHPKHGLLLPEEFLPSAEESGFIVQLGWWVLEESVAQLARWQKTHPALSMSVNVAARQLRESTFADRVLWLVKSHDVAPESVRLEVAESVIVESPDQGLVAFAHLVGAGLGGTVDDFGLAYASLVAVRRLPVQTVKLDPGFMARMATRSDEQAVSGAVVDAIRALGLAVAFEGVETPADEERARGLRGQFAQGHLYAPPGPAAVIETLLDHQFTRDPLPAPAREAGGAGVPAKAGAAAVEDLHVVVHVAPTPVWIKDVRGRYVYANPAFARRHGREADNVVGLTDFDLLPAAGAWAIEEEDHRALRAGVPSFGDQMSPAAAEADWTVLRVPIVDDTGTPIGIGGIATGAGHVLGSNLALRNAGNEVPPLHRAFELNDNVVQALVIAEACIQFGDTESALANVSRALEATRGLMSGLVVAAGGPTPGDLVRSEPNSRAIRTVEDKP